MIDELIIIIIWNHYCFPCFSLCKAVFYLDSLRILALKAMIITIVNSNIQLYRIRFWVFFCNSERVYACFFLCYTTSNDVDVDVDDDNDDDSRRMRMKRKNLKNSIDLNWLIYRNNILCVEEQGQIFDWMEQR